MSHPEKLVTRQLRAQFAAGLSAMYAGAVPAYATLVEVSQPAIGPGIHDPYALYEALSKEAPR
jgi:uncharacterized glyoxalase superfamily metalloenzyme YdcJ